VLGFHANVQVVLVKTCRCCSNAWVDELTLYDIVNVPGVAADLSDVNTPCMVKGYLPPDDGLRYALKNATLVFLLAGIHQKVSLIPLLATWFLSS
jgi:malate/lactate dehydrogenase